MRRASKRQDQKTTDNTARQTTWRVYVVVALATLAEIGLFAGFLYGLFGAVPVIAAHAAILLALAIFTVYLDRKGEESGAMQLFLLATAAGGPVGALGAAFFGYPHSRRISRSLQEWYDTIAPPQKMVVTLYDQIRDGRSVQVNAFMPKRFDAILKKGTLREKQALLSYLANHYSPDHAAILRMAMDSREPAVRVQASAVAANLRMQAHRTSPPRVELDEEGEVAERKRPALVVADGKDAKSDQHHSPVAARRVG